MADNIEDKLSFVRMVNDVNIPASYREIMYQRHILQIQSLHSSITALVASMFVDQATTSVLLHNLRSSFPVVLQYDMANKSDYIFMNKIGCRFGPSTVVVQNCGTDPPWAVRNLILCGKHTQTSLLLINNATMNQNLMANIDISIDARTSTHHGMAGSSWMERVAGLAVHGSHLGHQDG